MKFIYALVVKLVDTKDLKSFRLRSAVPGLNEGISIIMSKLLLISDKNPKSLKVKEINLLSKLKNSIINLIILQLL